MSDLPDGGLTDRQLKFSYWYVSHKLSLRKGLVIFLILISVLLWFFVGWQLTFYFINYKADRQLESYLLFTSDPSLAKIESQKPQDFSLSEVQVFETGTGYDYMATISNANKDWLAEFDYQIVSGTSTSAVKTGYVLPDSASRIMEFNQPDPQPNLRVTNVKWTRIGNYPSLKNRRDYFTIENDKLTVGQGKDPSELTFAITNGSPYSYWNVDIQVMLYSGGSPVGINHATIGQFKAGEKRTVDIFWNHNIPSDVTYEIFPVVNFLDSQNIMPVGQ